MKRLNWRVVVLALVGVAAMVAGAWLLLSGRPAGELGNTATPTAATASPPLDAAPTDRPAATATIVLLFTNDLHGAVEPKVAANGKRETGGLVNLVSRIDQLRAEDPEHTLLLDAGDVFQGSFVSNSSQGELVMAAMNLAGYDAWALGNHEFDWGQELLQARIAQANFPTLAANVLSTADGRVWQAVQPYTIIPVGEAQVAILGLAYPDTPTITRVGNVEGLEFRGAVETVSRYLPELEEKAELVVVLSHLGHDGDRALAAAVPGIDVIVGGHTHLFLQRPERVNGALIVQAGAKGEVVGRLALTVDLGTETITEPAPGNLLLPVTNEVPAVNKAVQELVGAAMAEAAETMNQPIGTLARAVEPQRAGESALGNLIVDAMLAAEMSDGRPADIAMHNNGGIRAGLPKGPITYGQLYAVLPFDNQLIALDLTGAQVLRILEHSVTERAGAMQVAGMAFSFRMANQAGRRVMEATVGGRPLDPERVYRVVTIDYLAGGGDGQDAFLEGANPSYGDQAAWAVAEYFRTHSPLDPKVEGRVVSR